tara:strand:- start:11665 stop:12078 length:414 start_codon:yes stop_codon:yes gene_type:complete
MDTQKAFDILNISWSRENILSKVKKGHSPDKIVFEFIKDNKESLDSVNKYLVSEKNSGLLDQMEAISNCELKLINEFKKNLIISNESNNRKIKKEPEIYKMLKDFSFELFMKRWSNQFVIGVLIMISLFSLSKQAWT